ncbi:MAG: FHA domain-containing protein [Chloroflexi bacterium]|nr:MAG: FHA domain-containing protein [Chloroflexota bacterium]
MVHSFQNHVRVIISNRTHKVNIKQAVHHPNVMQNRQNVAKKPAPTRIILLLLGLLFHLIRVTSVQAQSGILLRLGSPDISHFPTVQLNLQTADLRSVPLGEVTRLSLRENGIPIGDVNLQSVPVGFDVIFVIDSNESILATDGSEQNRLQITQESITRFATRFMSPTGLDRVTIIVPDDADSENGRILLDAATLPADVIAAINNYTPLPQPATPINQMMLTALTKAQTLQTDNRFQAILLFSDASQLSQQLAYDELIAQAVERQVAIFGAILGSDVTTTEINSITRLADPTRGSYERIATVEATDPFYLVWQRQANQTQITYQSLLTKNGRFPLTVNIGDATAATEIALNLQPPAVTLQVESDVVRRVGTAVDSLLSELVPTFEPIQVTVSWPDGIPRTVSAITLLVNGIPQFLPDQLQPDASGNLMLTWNIQNSDTGAYELVVQVTDTLNLTGESSPQLVTIVSERPTPPTPTPIPTIAPTPTPTSPLETIPRDNLILGGLALVLAVVILLFLGWLRRNRTILAAPPPQPRVKTAVSPPPSTETDEPPLGPHTALLELLDPDLLPEAELTLTQDNMLIGREESAAQLVLTDKTVAPLHARIRKRNGRYWLYDEGSTSGTFLNHTRLGLAPRQLQNGDLIQIGRLRFHFRIQFDEAATA